MISLKSNEATDEKKNAQKHDINYDDLTNIYIFNKKKIHFRIFIITL